MYVIVLGGHGVYYKDRECFMFSKIEIRDFTEHKSRKLIILLFFVFCCSSVYAGEKKVDKSVYNAHGVSSTGFNRKFDEPLYNLGQFGGLGFNTIGEYIPGGDEAAPLTKNTPRNVLLATYVDESFLNSFQGDSPYIAPTDSLNVLLRDVKSNVDVTGVNFQTIPDLFEVEPFVIFQHGQGVPYFPIHLHQWLKAKGQVSIVCNEGEMPVITLQAKNLIPNRFYSVWGFFDDHDAQLPFENFGPIRPVGGIPNIVVTDLLGNATFKRKLNFCPMDLKEGEKPLATIFLAFHSNQHFGGSMMSFPDQGRMPGNAVHIQLHFPVSAQQHNTNDSSL